MKHLFSISTIFLSLSALVFFGCLDNDEEEDAGPGSIKFQIIGEDITYDHLTGEDGYLHVSYATIDYAYMIVKTPKLNPGDHAALAKASHTGISVSGMFAVNLNKPNRNVTVFGTVEDVESGDYSGNPSISIYNPTPSERSEVNDIDNVLDKIPDGYSFLFGGTIHEKDGTTSYRYEIRENVHENIAIEEFPHHESEGTPLTVKPGKTLIAEFHPHIDHALEVICHDNNLDFETLETSGDTVIFSPTMNADYYDAIEGHINRGDHWDVNVIPE